MTQLGKYELHEQLGKGGFGTVYLATDTSLGREVALKVLHPQMAADAEFVERFRREAKIAANLDHPNIVPVYEAGEDNGRIFLALKYMSRGSLKQAIAERGRIAFAEALRILDQAGKALDFMHSKGVIHRDLKPGNILFDESGMVRLSDFGLAKALQESSSITSSLASFGGTPPYTAPEIWRNRGASNASDIYALGCIFYEMITGQVLFQGDSPAEIMTHHVLEGARFSEKWLGDNSQGVESVLAKALAQAPENRYQDARTFIQALREAASRQEAVPPQTTVIPPALNETNLSANREMKPENTVKPFPETVDEAAFQKPRKPIRWLTVGGVGCGIVILIAICLAVGSIIKAEFGQQVYTGAEPTYSPVSTAVPEQAEATSVPSQPIEHTVTITLDHDAEGGCVNGQDWSACRNIPASNLNVSEEYLDGTVSADLLSNGFAIRRLFLYFDTSSIPASATITNASLKFYAGGSQEGNTTIHVVQSLGENSYTPTEFNNIRFESGGSIQTLPNQWFEITLNPAGIQAIHPNGWTHLVLIHELDLTDAGTSGPNNVLIARAKSAKSPYLWIRYTLPKP